MALNEITKGMSNAAEMINDNFKNVGIIDSGTNEDGNYLELSDGTVIAYGNQTFKDNAGWSVGKTQRVDSGTMPSAYKKPFTILYADYSASLYDGTGGFGQFKVELSKISLTVGTLEVTRNSGNVSKSNNLNVTYFHIGKKA